MFLFRPNLEKLFRKSKVKNLIRYLADEELGKEAASYLAALGSVAVQPLLLALENNNEIALKNTIFAIALNTDSQKLQHLIDLAEDNHQKTALRRKAILVLCVIGDVRAIPVLIQWSCNYQLADARMRQTIVSSIAHIGVESVPFLAGMESRYDSTVRRILNKIGTPAIKYLQPLLNDPDPVARRFGVSGLLAIGINKEIAAIFISVIENEPTQAERGMCNYIKIQIDLTYYGEEWRMRLNQSRYRDFLASGLAEKYHAELRKIETQGFHDLSSGAMSPGGTTYSIVWKGFTEKDLRVVILNYLHMIHEAEDS